MNWPELYESTIKLEQLCTAIFAVNDNDLVVVRVHRNVVRNVELPRVGTALTFTPPSTIHHPPSQHKTYHIKVEVEGIEQNMPVSIDWETQNVKSLWG